MNKKYKEGFYELKALPGLFTRVTTFLFALLIQKNEIITYFDDIMIQAENKTQLLDQLRDFQEKLMNSRLKTAPDKTYFFHGTV